MFIELRLVEGTEKFADEHRQADWNGHESIRRAPVNELP